MVALAAVVGMAVVVALAVVVAGLAVGPCRMHYECSARAKHKIDLYD